MSTTALLITVISGTVLTPLLAYFVNSRCTTIETPCCKIQREIAEQVPKEKKTNEIQETRL